MQNVAPDVRNKSIFHHILWLIIKIIFCFKHVLKGMLIAVLFVLSAVKVNGDPVDQDGLRKLRQLDLGLQDIHPTVSEISTTVQLPLNLKNDVVGGYLPPVSSSEFASAQSQQAFDFKSANSLEKERKMCKSPLDNCDFKESSESDSKIPKPSRDLVPPFNDLERELVAKEPGLREETKKQTTKTTTDYQSKVITTTEKAATKTSKRTPTRSTTRLVTTTLRPKAAANKVEATNEVRSYLPPQSEFSAAAQTNVAVVQPINQNRNHDHDHHHGHHHGDDFNICADAFHSFLCAPLKARKRITGALPESLKSQSSFINYQKSLLNFDRETAPSNTFRNEYLPPNPSPTNLIQSSYLPPLTTKRLIGTTATTPRPYSPTKITSEPSNSIDRFRFAPITDNKIPNPSFVKFAPSNQEYSTVKPSTTSVPIAFSKTTSSTASSSFFQKLLPVQNIDTSPSNAAVFNSLASNENKFYLPPNPNPQPSASVISTSQNIFPLTSTFSSLPVTFTPLRTVSTFTPYSTVSTFAPQSRVSTFAPQSRVSTFAPQSTVSTFTPYSTVSTFAPQSTVSTFAPQSTVSTFAPQSTVSTFAPQSTVSTFAPLSSNSIFVPQKPKVQPTIPIFTTTAKTTVFTTTPKPIIQLSSFSAQPSKPSNSYIPPATKFQSPSTTTTKTFTSTFKYSEQSSNTDRSYLPPDVKEPAAAQISSTAVTALEAKNPFHHGRDLCTDPFHSFLCTSAKPRKRITGQAPLGFKPESSNTDESRLKPEPSSQDENKVRPDKLLEGSSAQNLGYQYLKPINPLPTPSNPVISSTLSSSTVYSYSKPDKILPLPSQETIKFTSAASSVTSKKPEPVPNPKEAKVLSGYQYPKPDKVFPLPAEPENAKVITTTSLPTTGYSYPRPQKPFPLPTEQKEIVQKIKQKGTTSFASSSPLPTNQVKGLSKFTSVTPSVTSKKPEPVPTPSEARSASGYQYSKPDQSLKLPEKKGYSYPKPEKRLELPNENRSKFLLPQSSSNLDALKNLGSADFIPVNKIEYKRAEPSKLLVGLRKFGERMKKRERQAQLLKRQLH